MLIRQFQVTQQKNRDIFKNWISFNCKFLSHYIQIYAIPNLMLSQYPMLNNPIKCISSALHRSYEQWKDQGAQIWVCQSIQYICIFKPMTQIWISILCWVHICEQQKKHPLYLCSIQNRCVFEASNIRLKSKCL